MVTRNASVLTYLIQFKYMQSRDLLSHLRCLEFQNELVEKNHILSVSSKNISKRAISCNQ